MSDSDAAAAYLASLHRKRMAAGTLFVDSAGRALLVEPAYTKETWDIPGGGVEEDESPRAAARREVAEELGLDREPARSWMRPGRRSCWRRAWRGASRRPCGLADPGRPSTWRTDPRRRTDVYPP